MKLQPKPPTDPRTALLTRATADASGPDVATAPTPQQAWLALGLPGERSALDPAHTQRLAEAATALCGIADSIAKGLVAFGALEDDADVPPSWVERMVDLHVQELEGYWRLDELAHAGVTAGGWTAAPPWTEAADDAVARIAQRAHWQVEALKPDRAALWFDKLAGRLDRTAATGEYVQEAGRALVAEATRRRFAGWQATRRGT